MGGGGGIRQMIHLPFGRGGGVYIIGGEKTAEVVSERALQQTIDSSGLQKTWRRVRHVVPLMREVEHPDGNVRDKQ